MNTVKIKYGKSTYVVNEDGFVYNWTKKEQLDKHLKWTGSFIDQKYVSICGGSKDVKPIRMRTMDAKIMWFKSFNEILKIEEVEERQMTAYDLVQFIDRWGSIDFDEHFIEKFNSKLEELK